MKKCIIAVLVLVCILAMLTACGSKEITPEKAQKIVLEDLGVSADEAELHVHIGEYEGKPCYSIYVTIEGETLEYLVDSATGEILDINESSHSH